MLMSTPFLPLWQNERNSLLDGDFCYNDEQTPATPTDSYESSSVCSDLRDRDLRESAGEDESVSERIFRKSFYTRFNSQEAKKEQVPKTNNPLAINQLSLLS